MLLSDLIGSSIINGVNNNNPPAGFQGYYGRGSFQTFNVSGNYTVPPNVTRLRVRVIS